LPESSVSGVGSRVVDVDDRAYTSADRRSEAAVDDVGGLPMSVKVSVGAAEAAAGSDEAAHMTAPAAGNGAACLNPVLAPLFRERLAGR
jgi:hypothetical protein